LSIQIKRKEQGLTAKSMSSPVSPVLTGLSNVNNIGVGLMGITARTGSLPFVNDLAPTPSAPGSGGGSGGSSSPPVTSGGGSGRNSPHASGGSSSGGGGMGSNNGTGNGSVGTGGGAGNGGRTRTITKDMLVRELASRKPPVNVASLPFYQQLARVTHLQFSHKKLTHIPGRPTEPQDPGFHTCYKLK
jgi:hypothetical protein